jgi:hypothetical protein
MINNLNFFVFCDHMIAKKSNENHGIKNIALMNFHHSMMLGTLHLMGLFMSFF